MKDECCAWPKNKDSQGYGSNLPIILTLNINHDFVSANPSMFSQSESVTWVVYNLLKIALGIKAHNSCCLLRHLRSIALPTVYLKRMLTITNRDVPPGLRGVKAWLKNFSLISNHGQLQNHESHWHNYY